MKPTKDGSSFQERISRAAEAKQKALERLRAKPPVDAEALAARQAARERREAEAAEKRAQRQAALQAEREEKAAKAAAAKAQSERPQPTEAERKLARDARYAARKNRK